MMLVTKIGIVCGVLAVGASAAVIPYIGVESWKRDRAELAALRDELQKLRLNNTSAELASESIQGDKWRRIHYRSVDGTMEAWITFDREARR